MGLHPQQLWRGFFVVVMAPPRRGFSTHRSRIALAKTVVSSTQARDSAGRIPLNSSSRSRAPTTFPANGPAAVHRRCDVGQTMRWRPLVRDYEARLDVPKAMVRVAMSGLQLRKISL